MYVNFGFREGLIILVLGNICFFWTKKISINNKFQLIYNNSLFIEIS